MYRKIKDENESKKLAYFTVYRGKTLAMDGVMR
jgi:hypothetical protein